MRGQLAFFADQGFDVLLVCSPGDLLDATARREGVRSCGIPMEREIRLGRDIRALVRLIRLFRAERPDISIVSTPKAGLLAGLAAFFTRVPRRIYVLRGMRLETASGSRWAILWILEWISLHAAHEVIAVSPSLLALARRLRLLGSHRGTVLGGGGSNGIDLARFAPSEQRLEAARALRRVLGIPHDGFVFGFVGRLVPDKGIVELMEAFARLRRTNAGVWLMVAGRPETGGVTASSPAHFEAAEGVRYLGWVSSPETAYHAFDALVLPTYREGFPTVCVEAAAAGKPVITTTATGAVDSVEPGTTGFLVPPRDVEQLHGAMRALAADPGSARAMGEAGRQRAASYSNEEVWSQLARALRFPGPTA